MDNENIYDRKWLKEGWAKRWEFNKEAYFYLADQPYSKKEPKTNAPVNNRPKKNLQWDIASVVFLHQLIMGELTLSPNHLRAPGILESALYKPQMAQHYSGADLILQITLLTFGVAQSQAFVDGNKRTAFAVADMTLWTQGESSFFPPLAFAIKLEELGSPEVKEKAKIKELERWMRVHLDVSKDLNS
jgi:prophage maintenance system killer protein